MKPYVSDLLPNVEVTSFFLVADLPQVRKNKNDKDYASLELCDKTGKIDARLWDIPPGLDVNSLKGQFVKVKGNVTEWAGKNQVSILQIRVVGEADEFDVGDFFERSKRPPGDMYHELHELLFFNVGLSKPIDDLLRMVLEGNKEAFCTAPAAKSVHHNYIGGLLEHVLSMCHMAVQVQAHYDLNGPLLLAGCVLHDIGKIRELTYPIGGYTLEGTLLGHISIGMQMVAKAMDDVGDFPQNLKIAVLHLIASHHGILAWGSPKVPLMREALALHLIDMLDSKIAICNKAITGGLDDKGLTQWVKELEGPIFALGEN
jgi:3'-5' exoribonuclease